LVLRWNLTWYQSRLWPWDLAFAFAATNTLFVHKLIKPMHNPLNVIFYPCVSALLMPHQHSHAHHQASHAQLHKKDIRGALEDPYAWLQWSTSKIKFSTFLNSTSSLASASKEHNDGFGLSKYASKALVWPCKCYPSIFFNYSSFPTIKHKELTKLLETLTLLLNTS